MRKTIWLFAFLFALSTIAAAAHDELTVDKIFHPTNS